MQPSPAGTSPVETGAPGTVPAGITVELDAVGVVVRDMAATVAFYRLVGLPVPEGAEAAPHVEVALPGGMRLMFDTEDVLRSFMPDFTPPSGDGRVGLAVRVPGPADVDTLYARITAAGHHGELAPFDAPWGQRYASVLDPDGTGVDLYAPLGRAVPPG